MLVIGSVFVVFDVIRMILLLFYKFLIFKLLYQSLIIKFYARNE